MGTRGGRAWGGGPQLPAPCSAELFFPGSPPGLAVTPNAANCRISVSSMPSRPVAPPWRLSCVASCCTPRFSGPVGPSPRERRCWALAQPSLPHLRPRLPPLWSHVPDAVPSSFGPPSGQRPALPDQGQPPAQAGTAGALGIASEPAPFSSR